MSQYPPQDPFDPQQQPRAQYQSPNRGPTPAEPGIATVALVLGIVAIVLSPLLIFGIAAFIVGIIAINKTGGPQNIPGRGKAIAGVALGGSGFGLGLVLALIAILLPALGAARRTARRMQNATQVRSVHQGMVMAGQRNKYFYPGLDSRGDILSNGPLTGNSGDGDTVEARYWILLDGAYITSDYTISPSEIDAIVPWTSGQVSASNYSYAMLSIQGQAGSAPTAGPRASEWKETANGYAVVISDRNTGSSTQSPESIHTDGDPWKGTVLWNDNHTGFEQTHLLETRYGRGSIDMNDNIFDASGDDDALLIHSGD